MPKPKGRGGSCECCNTDIALSPDGDIYISFRSDIDDRRDVWIARSLDGGTFTTIRAASETWTINACPMTGSSIVLDQTQTAHVVWRDSRPSAQGRDSIYYTRLPYGDSACIDDMSISATPAKSNYPTLALAPDGSLFCAFQDNRNDESDILMVTSRDGGRTFSAPVEPTGESTASRQEEPQLTVAPNGDRYLVWQDAARDEGDIMFAKDTSTLGSISGVRERSVDGLELEPAEPNPADAATTLGYTVTRSMTGERVMLTVYDMLGRIILDPIAVDASPGRHELRLDCTPLPPGQYRCAISTGSLLRSRVIVVVR